MLVLVSGVISLGVVGFIQQRFRQQLLDIPNERSSHSQPTPRGGGLGFIVAFALTGAIAQLLPTVFPDLHFPTLMVRGWTLPLMGLLGVSLLPLAIVGFLDDRQSVPALWRYLVQLSAASLAVLTLGPFPQPWLIGWGWLGTGVAIALTLVGMTAIINFYNFMDGLDGLVGGVSAVQFSFLALYLHQPYLALLVAALLGFLWWNWSPAKIFMGDVGSTALGAMVAIALLQGSTEALQAWSAFGIALPLLLDAIYTLARRLLRQENIFQAHRTHIYQRLQRFGWSHAQVASLYMGLTLAVGCSIWLWNLTGLLLSLGALGACLAAGELYLQRLQLAQGQ